MKKKKYTSRGQISKNYQCPFGEFDLCRHVYQSNEGGSIYCPLDNDVRIIIYSTPKFAKMANSKYSQSGSAQVQRDLRENHGRSISRNYIQHISQAVGDIAEKKQSWQYQIPVQVKDVWVMGLSLDGACYVDGTACKVIIKQRMCNSGMKWPDQGAKSPLILRCFNETDGKWNQF